MKMRKSYSMEYKNSILTEEKEKSISEVARIHKLDLRMIRRWKQTIRLCDELNMNDTARRIIGGKPTIKELEDSIFDWIVERRSRSLVVRRKDFIWTKLFASF